jgi:hypothetical protein
MSNNRIFYACQAVAIGPFGNVGGYTVVHGVQSVGINSTFNLEQAFELGQIEIYENIEGLPEVEVTLEKVLDGYPLMYHLATDTSSANTLVSRTKERCNAVLAIYSDAQDSVTGVPPVEVYMSGLYVNSIGYTIPVEGNSTESITLVGNHKEWNITGTNFPDGSTDKFTSTMGGEFDGDEPLNLQVGFEAGGIQRRENVKMDLCKIPESIFGVTKAVGGAAPAAGNNYANNAPLAHIQNISISVDLGREDILELGRKAPYFRAPNFPVEVTSEFEVIAISGDFISAYENGDPDFDDTRDEGNNTKSETILIVLQDGTAFDLGDKNRLSSVTYGGADAGGGNASMTYSYSTFNKLDITPPHD